MRNPQTQDTDGVGYKLVPMTIDVVRVLATTDSEGLIGTFRNDRRPIPNVKIGVGDVVGVSIFEASSGGLFIPAEAASRAGNFVDLPDQSVDPNGLISVPYAGQIKAVGLSPSQVEKEIVDRLRNRAIEPQAVVTVKTQRSNAVTVTGELETPLRFPLTSAGERILDAVSRGGRAQAKGYDLMVTLQRGNREATISFNRLIREPANNIYLQPDDTIYVFSRPRTFLAFGATGKQGQFNFGEDSISLSEAAAKAEGLLDQQADPQSVFLFRIENRATLERMGVDVSTIPDKRIPTIYTVNFREPTGYLMSTKVPMRDKDIIYIGNAGSVELTKFLNLVLLGATTAREIADANNLVSTAN
ncbi:polysaccharide biosynthesis/export family protein [Xanthobacter oligotrophicus]|uniref:polysaccharide biosynthesis/export family protein n=1 Tax=Xanthobacter oligotrophicus TaxID=2607286 RepID=UPI001E49C610|nr:polysaccharide biosynthesis/export family protein [Xanthobacter oligotrophicus]MCG5237555.1 polysaccharide export protein [Xanthobacter oligotrophicus]